MTKSEFVERHGEPSFFVFNGQFYDAGPSSKTKCAVCERAITHVYILKNDRGRSTPISSCCFSYFNGLPIQKQLLAAQILMGVVVDAEARDKKLFGPRLEVRERKEKWKQIKHQALDLVRAYKRQTGKEWLPEELFNLQVTAEKQPTQFKRATTAARWYEKTAAELELKVRAASQGK